MAVLKKQFFHHRSDIGDEDWYYLARDTDSHHVFVLREWSHRNGDTFEPGSGIIEVPVFLNQRGSAQDRLIELIGTLANDSLHAVRP